MDRNTEIELLERCLAARSAKECETNNSVALIDVNNYVSGDIFNEELHKVFDRLPIILMHSSALATVNSYVTLDHRRGPLLATRDEHGQVHVMLNVCRHRGARVVHRAQGQCARFTCPYHAWTYDVAGSLTNATQLKSFPSLSRADVRLISLPVIEAYGFIWLMPEDSLAEKSHLDDFLGEARETLMYFDIHKGTLFSPTSKVWDVNWKLVLAGALESYHFPSLHRDTAYGILDEHCFVYDPLGDHFRVALGKRRLGLLKTPVTSEQRLRDWANIICFIFPNQLFLVQSDHVLWISCEPVEAGKTLVTMTMIVPEPCPSDDDQRKLWERNRDLGYRVQEEDLIVQAEVQSNIRTGANSHHTLGTRESVAQAFHASVTRYLSR
jgi:phenylpropionate dioxygenase-like ring-hydroxylating dioxygenase large terminal subunit